MNGSDKHEPLLIAIGNDGRSDDGLGWSVADRLEEIGGFPGPVLRRFQLQVEDADKIARYQEVIFVDASVMDLPEGFRWEKVGASPGWSFSTHSLSPGAVLHLCQEVYDAYPDCYLLSIQGVEWGLGIGLSDQALENREKALQSLQRWLRGAHLFPAFNSGRSG